MRSRSRFSLPVLPVAARHHAGSGGAVTPAACEPMPHARMVLNDTARIRFAAS